MRRLIVVGVVVLAAAAAVGVVAVSRSRSGGDSAVARVGSRTITRHDLQLMVDHFQEEADREGRPFPSEGSAAYDVVRRQALALIVARAEEELAAGKLGVRVADADVDRRIASGGGGEAESGTIHAAAEAAFLRSTARAQIVEERVASKLDAGIHVSRADARAYYRAHRLFYGRRPFAEARAEITRQLLALRRNAAFERWRRGARAAARVDIRDPSLKG